MLISKTMMHNRNNISNHIERLLLTNDKVSIPSFGFFSVSYVASEISDKSGLLFPPKRIVDFQLDKAAYDTLLLQSYSDNLDLSIPEAQKVLNDDILQLTSELSNEGEYYFHGIGTLTKNNDNTFVFEADAAGIVTPYLYGLSSFEFKPLKKQSVPEESEQKARIISIAPLSHQLHIAMTPARKLAAAAITAFVAFSFISMPAGNGSDSRKVIQASILSSDIIHSVVEAPVKQDIAVTQEQIADFNASVKPAEQEDALEADNEALEAERESRAERRHRTTVVHAAPTSVTVNISYDDMKKVVEEHEQEMTNEADSVS